MFVLDVGEGGKGGARCLLAHPAMADADLGRYLRYRKADGATLAAAGQDRLVVVFRHACSIRRQASCSIASASLPAKMKSPTPADRSASDGADRRIGASASNLKFASPQDGSATGVASRTAMSASCRFGNSLAPVSASRRLAILASRAARVAATLRWIRFCSSAENMPPAFSIS